jgi:hypothetical protein
MKVFFSTSILGFVIVLLTIHGGLSSCTKEKTIYDTITVTRTDTVTVKDTVVISDTTVSTELLTAHSWKIQYFRGVYGGDSVVYLRGGINNTQNYDADYVTFNADGTGFNNDAVGGAHQITEWQFTNAEHTQITFKYHLTPSSVYHFITWDNLRFKNNTLMYDEYYYDNFTDVNVHDQTVRIPR